MQVYKMKSARLSNLLSESVETPILRATIPSKTSDKKAIANNGTKNKLICLSRESIKRINAMTHLR
jgi:hypothetical protein